MIMVGTYFLPKLISEYGDYLWQANQTLKYTVSALPRVTQDQ